MMNKLILAVVAVAVPAGLMAQRAPHPRPVRQHPVVVQPHPGNWTRPRIHARRFVYPRGYAYRRWAVGALLPRVFLAPAYYYAGYAALGLYAPRTNYQWVRYGPDLLLVNIATGNVIDIRYGVFD